MERAEERGWFCQERDWAGTLQNAAADAKDRQTDTSHVHVEASQFHIADESECGGRSGGDDRAHAVHGHRTCGECGGDDIAVKITKLAVTGCCGVLINFSLLNFVKPYKLLGFKKSVSFKIFFFLYTDAVLEKINFLIFNNLLI